MIKKDCYKMFNQSSVSFCLNCSNEQREFCKNIMGRLEVKMIKIRAKTLKEKGFYCSLHNEELDEKGICCVCEDNEQTYIYEKLHNL